MQGLAAHRRQLGVFTVVIAAVMGFLSVLFIWLVLARPIRDLTRGTHQVADGDLSHRLPVHSRDELGTLAESFNTMTGELAGARNELTTWAHTLEERVEEKTKELKRAHEHMLQAEKMASVGKLAAVVAHEINNPLAGILTYAKLLRKWLERNEWNEKRDEVKGSLELVETESRRCGEIVKNLLTFSRTAPIHLEPTELGPIFERVTRLVHHQCELAGIRAETAIAEGLPAVTCDPAAVEQVLLALVMNAIDAMPHGGNLWLRARLRGKGEEVELQVADDGVGIPADVLGGLFEPFFTTKERGVGLGLAISKGLVERHGGRIAVASEAGKGTTFTITLPLQAGAPRDNPMQEIAAEPVKAR
jgi:two-component system NtrC family sensor kinase